MEGSAPLAMNTPQPERRAILAAVILEIMPPVAVTSVVPPAMASISGVIFSTTGRMRPVPFISIRPGAVERMTSWSASTRPATRAERVSLSPNLISAALTVSFSLITGMTP